MCAGLNIGLVGEWADVLPSLGLRQLPARPEPHMLERQQYLYPRGLTHGLVTGAWSNVLCG